MTTQALEPCPFFCGKTNAKAYSDHASGWIGCECGARGPRVNLDVDRYPGDSFRPNEKQKAISAWNRRQSLAAGGGEQPFGYINSFDARYLTEQITSVARINIKKTGTKRDVPIYTTPPAPSSKPCDMGELCIGCEPRNSDGSCPGAAPAPSNTDANAQEQCASCTGTWPDYLLKEGICIKCRKPVPSSSAVEGIEIERQARELLAAECSRPIDSYSDDDKRALRAIIAALASTAASGGDGADRMAIRMLVAAGFVSEDKATEALRIAQGLDSGPLSAPAMPDGFVLIRKAVVNFLEGEGPLDGHWFDEPAPGLSHYWWRKYLHEQPLAASAQGDGDE